MRGGARKARVVHAAAALIAALGPSVEAASAHVGDALTQLDRYRPILRYDAGESYFAQPASRTAEVSDRDVVYGHVAKRAGTRWLQYWLFYAANTQDRGILRTGRHEGDWEFLQLRLGADGRPVTATFAQHSSAETCPYEDLELVRSGGVRVPRVYVAEGSHASYPRAGTVDRPWPDPNDEADGSGRTVRPPVRPITDRHPAWVAYRGRWGGNQAGPFPGEQSSPPGPRFQPDGRWQDPAAYERAARPCGSPPPSRSWQTPLLIGLAIAAGGFAARRGWRRAHRPVGHG